MRWTIFFTAWVIVGVSDFVEVSFGGLTILITFGKKRGLITVILGCPEGLTVVSWELALDYVNRVCEDRGYVGLDWMVSMCEVLNDHESRRLDGVSGYTITDFNSGVIEKIYEKPNGDVRHERRFHGGTPVDTVTSFLMGGLAGVESNERLSALEKLMEDQITATKYLSSVVFAKGFEA